ncbi:MAG: TIGR02678 family protein [Pseudonocardiaceae bacterium]|nr:TIGR02678 family protein [Pseudonocardiaceae bacterium]
MNHRVATDVPDLELASYQRAVRAVLRHPLITETHPDAGTLPLVRRWSGPLRTDLAEALGYRLELSGTAARLIRACDDLDPTQPARTRTKREFDRQRYAYLALVLAALGRAGIQIALSELAEAVAADAKGVTGLGLDTTRAADRAAFVDVVSWLEDRGALRLADGSARAWADDPGRAEALYDIDRDVASAVYRPSRVAQHLRSVSALLARPAAASRNAARRDAGQRARRALIEQPVVYHADADDGVRNILRTPSLVEDVQRLTGLTVERRAEGLLLVDTAGLSERRFPSTGTVSQAALLLVREIADRVVDPDAPALHRLAAPSTAERLAPLVEQVDAGLPTGTVLTGLADPDEPADSGSLADSGSQGEPDDPAEPDDQQAATEPETEHPLVEDGWLGTTMRSLVERYGSAFGAGWRADPQRLLVAALDLLIAHRLVARVDGGVLALPLLGRYRNVVVEVRSREPDLFAVEETS